MAFFSIYAIVTGFLLLIMAWRTRRFARHLMSLQDMPAQYRLTPAQRAHEDSKTWPKVSVIIPACNEAETIESAMRSLLSIDYPNLEVIMIDDRSTDGTGEIIDQMAARDFRIRTAHITHLPKGWLGKVHALNRGMELATAEWILFTDADVHFAPDSLKNAMAFCLKDRLDFLTAVPDVVAQSRVLQIVIGQLFHQASLFFNPNKINDPSHRACYGQGAFMLVRKSRYLVSERLEWLKMEVVDDTGLALLMRRAGARMGAVSGRNQIRIEWYPSLFSFLKGIEKNAFAFSQYSLPILLSFTAAIWVLFLGFAAAPFLTKHTSYYCGFSLGCVAVYMWAVRTQLKALMEVRTWMVFTLPVALAILPLLFLRASLLTLKRGGVNWRGTFYSLEALKANQRMKLANLVFASEPAQAVEQALEVDSPKPVLGRIS